MERKAYVRPAITPVKRKAYVRPVIAPVSMELESPVMAGSVIVQNNMIKATDQEVVEYDFSEETFELNWE